MVRAPTELDRWYGVMVLIWLSGTLVCGLRLLGGAIALERLTRRTTTASTAHLRLVERLGGTIGLRRLPRLLVSTRVTEAIATGFFRPVIVFPAAWLSELPPAVIEAVLAHELAHIRRYDLWVNLLQRAVEAVLFFHPAVWWVSQQVRSDREMCCDALAVAATGQKVSYVRALETVARRAAREPAFGLATGIGGRKMQLLARVRHVLGLPAGQRAGGWWAAGVLALAVPCGLWALSGPAAPSALAQDDREEAREREERAERQERERADRDSRHADEERAVEERAERHRDVFNDNVTGQFGRRAREERAEAKRRTDRDERQEREQGDGDRPRPKREPADGADRDHKFDIELRFENDRPAREKQRRAAEDQRRRAEENEREARMALEKQQRAVHQAIERAQVELKHHLAEAQEKLSGEIRRAEDSGEKEKAQALRRQIEQMRDQAAEQALALDEKLQAIGRDVRDGEATLMKALKQRATAAQKQVEALEAAVKEGTVAPDLLLDARRRLADALSDTYLDEKKMAERKAGEMREVAERMQKQLGEQLRALQQELEAARKKGDKIAMEQLGAEEAMMRQKYHQSLGGKMDKGMAARGQAEMRERGGMPGGPEAQREMMQMIKELRGEVQDLRREVRELRENAPKKKAKNQPKDKNAGVPMLEEIPYVGRLFRKSSPAEADANRIQVEEEEEELYRPKTNELYEPKTDEFYKVKPHDGADVKKSLEIDVNAPQPENAKNVEIEFTNDLLKNKLDPIQPDKGALEKLKPDQLHLQKAVLENALKKLKHENSDLKNALDELKRPGSLSKAASDVEGRDAAEAAHADKAEEPTKP
jgi:bla regulator protein blaR1